MSSYKLLAVTEHFWPENNIICDILGGLKGRGFKIDILCGQPNLPNGEFMKGYSTFHVGESKKDGMRIFRVADLKPGNFTGFRLFFRYILFPLSVLIHSGKLIKNKYDGVLVFQTDPVTCCLPANKIGKKLGVPVIICAQDVWPSYAYSMLEAQDELFKKFLKFITKRCYGKADTIIFNSAKAMQAMLSEIKTDVKTKVVPLYSEAEFEIPESNDDLTEYFAGSFNIVYTGNFSKYDGILVLVEAAEKLALDRIKDIRFIILGDGQYKRDVRDFVVKKGLSDYFFFEGHKKPSDLRKYINIADALCCGKMIDASVSGEHSVNIARFQAMGKPMLLFGGEEAREVIRNKKAGFYSEPGDSKGLYENIRYLYKMPRAERIKLEDTIKKSQDNEEKREAFLDCIEECFSGAEDENSSLKNIWDI